MDALRGWIVSVCTTVFFITAVEMLLPDNSLKKYSKFVLGLILMTVIINPLVRLLNQGAEITAFMNDAAISVEKQFSNSDSRLKENSIRDTLNVFKMNLEQLCIDKLKLKYPSDAAQVFAEVYYDDNSEEYKIKSIKVSMDNRSIRKINKVEIRTNTTANKDNIDDSKYGLEVKDYLSTVLELPEDKILVYKLRK